MNRIAAEVYEKETAVGSDKCVILPPRSRFVAKLNIPNWKRVRVGMFTSLVAAGTADGPPPGGDISTVNYSTHPSNHGGISFMSHPDAVPGTAGTWGYWYGGKMIPDGTRSSGSYLRRFSLHRAMNAVGTTRGDIGQWNGISNQVFTRGNPPITSLNSGSLAEQFASMIEWEVGRTEVSTEYSYRSARNITDVSSTNLEALMAGSLSRTAVGTTTEMVMDLPTPYLALSWPFISAHLRIHAWRVEVLETL